LLSSAVLASDRTSPRNVPDDVVSEHVRKRRIVPTSPRRVLGAQQALVGMHQTNDRSQALHEWAERSPAVPHRGHRKRPRPTRDIASVTSSHDITTPAANAAPTMNNGAEAVVGCAGRSHKSCRASAPPIAPPTNAARTKATRGQAPSRLGRSTTPIMRSARVSGKVPQQHRLPGSWSYPGPGWNGEAPGGLGLSCGCRLVTVAIEPSTNFVPD
jgi:hypothetical protein